MDVQTEARVLTDDWRQWVAENLSLGVERTRIAEVLLRAGFERQLVHTEIDRANAHPYVVAGRRLHARLAKQQWLASTLGRLEEMAPATIERRETIAVSDFFENFYARNRPIILTNALSHWRAMAIWSLDYLEYAVDPGEIELQGGREADPNYEQNSDRYKRKVPWRPFLAALRHGGRSNDYYLTANNGAANREALAPLWRDFGPIDGILVGDPSSEGFLWLGPQGTITPWHHDLTNNLLVQIMGRKRLTLASPAQTPRMRNHHHCYSEFGPDASCLSVPVKERPHLLQCDLGPGELIFLPIGWWHHVVALDASASLTFTNFEAPNDFHIHYPSFGDL